MTTLSVAMDTLQYGAVDGEDEPGDLAGGEVTHGHLVEPPGRPRVGAEEDDTALDLRREGRGGREEGERREGGREERGREGGRRERGGREEGERGGREFKIEIFANVIFLS